MKKTEEILLSVLSELDLTRAHIADDLEVSLQAVSNWCSRNRMPQKAISYFYNRHAINKEFLESGTGPVLKKNGQPQEQEHQAKYIKHLEEENDFLRELVKTLSDLKNAYNK